MVIFGIASAPASAFFTAPSKPLPEADKSAKASPAAVPQAVFRNDLLPGPSFFEVVSFSGGILFLLPVTWTLLIFIDFLNHDSPDYNNGHDIKSFMHSNN